MPRYELALIVRDLSRAALSDTLKRCCRIIWKEEAILRNMENLGKKTLPVKMLSAGSYSTTGNYFIFKFDSTVEGRNNISAGLWQDEEVLRPSIFTVEEEIVRPCEAGKECTFGLQSINFQDRKNWRGKAVKRTKMYKSLKK